MPHFPPSPSLTEWTLSLIFFCVCALKVNPLLCFHIRLKELTSLGTDAKPQLSIWGSHCRRWDWRQTYSYCVQVSAVIAVSLWDSSGQCGTVCAAPLHRLPNSKQPLAKSQFPPLCSQEATPSLDSSQPNSPSMNSWKKKNWAVYAVRKRTRERE